MIKSKNIAVIVGGVSRVQALLKFQFDLKQWNMVPDTPTEKEVCCSVPIRTNRLAEQFSYPNATAYCEYLSSTPQYKIQ